ncbi:MAG TPA: hypothetical protein VMU85_16690 [Stellaceae bacterium]|nr:hypothetical protein [Stellaceae bacterium]
MPNDGIDPGFPWPVAPAGQTAAAVPPADDGKPHVWAQKGFQFHDLLDIVNPLQHLPVVSSIYRWVTGDGIGNLPRVVGDTLYGGAVGFVSGLFSVLVKEESGKDVGEHVIATLTGGDDRSASATTQAAAPADPSAAETSAEPQPAPAAPAPAVAAATAAPEAAAAAPAAASPPAPTPAPPAPAVPDHAAIPLVRGAANTAATTGAPPAASKDPAETFRNEMAQRQRALQQRPATDNGRTLASRPVPLDIPAGALSGAPPQPRVIKVMAPTAPASPQAPSSAGDPTTSGSAAAPPSGQPIEISQKMLNALDKYMALQQVQGAGNAGRGAQLDVSQ